jgi:hypothetical protein
MLRKPTRGEIGKEAKDAARKYIRMDKKRKNQLQRIADMR